MTKQQDHERARDDAKTSNDFGRIGAQSAILINGGAATAILALVGSIAHDPAAGKIVLPLIPVPLTIYALGVFFATCALVVMSMSIESFMYSWMAEGGEGPAGRRGGRLWKIGLGLIAIALLCFIISSIYVAYLLGHIVLPQSK